MALLSGVRSMLNPHAPLFIPAAMREVEDFSPEWWMLVTTFTWFRDYWASQLPGEDVFCEEIDENHVVELLPENIDLDVDEEILNMEAQFEEFLLSSESDNRSGIAKGIYENGFSKNGEALVKNVNMKKQRSPVEPVKYWDKPAKHVSPKHSPRFIQQPR